MKRSGPWLGLAGGLLAQALIAQSVAPLADSATAYLFLVDTSFSMRREQVTVRNLAYELVRNGINGRMRAGDGFAIWTFDDEVHADRFSPQAWLPELNGVLAKRTYEFLRRQRCEKRRRMDKAVAAMTKLMHATDSLTVFLITDGDDAVEGTPFDRDLNAVYLRRYPDLHKARKPFVTVLVARNAKWVTWAVYTAGDRITVPGDPTRTVQAVAPSIPTVTPNPTPAPVPPPVVRSEKPSSVAAMPVTTPPEPLSKPAVATPSVAARPPVTNQPPAVVPAHETPAPRPSPPVAAPVTKEAASAVPVTPVPTPPPHGTPAPPPAVQTPPSPNQTPGLLPVPAAGQSNPSTPIPLVAEKAPPRNPSPAPAPLTAPNEASAKHGPEQTGVIVPPTPATGRGLLLFGTALLLLAIGLVYFWFRRGRVRAASSLITRSLDTRGK